MILSKDFTNQLTLLNHLLGSDFGIISNIKDQMYKVLAVSSELQSIKEGDVFVTRNTYCDQVVESKDIVTYTHVGTIKAMVLHPIYTAMQLESYIGEPLFLNGKIIGTLNFSGFNPKTPEFSPDEIAQVKKLAREIEATLQPITQD